MRSVVLGNGNLLIGIDEHGLVRDLYFDRVGLENHTNGRPQRVGIFIDGATHWLGGSKWKTVVRYLPETLISEVVAISDELGLRVTFYDFVYNETNIFVRRILIENLLDRKRDARVFFHNDVEVGGYTFGVTAFYYPKSRALIHHRGHRMFLFNGRFGDAAMDDFSVGMTRYAGLEGTWKDAEDGILSGNPIEHGRVDSTASFSVMLPAGGKSEGFYWMAAGQTLQDVLRLNDDILTRMPEHLFQTTRDFWTAWVNKQNFTFYGLTEEQVRLFKTSLLVMRAHADNGGAIIASSDSDMLQHGKDTYSYMWPRDGAFVATAFAKSGYWDLARRFFEFMAPLVSTDGYLMHKYLSDGSLGSSWHPWLEDGHEVLPIQEDESAIMLHALWTYYEMSRDVEFIEEIYNAFIKKIANFLVEYRHKSTQLPLHSYDLWEEHRSVSTYTAACVVGGLEAAARFAELLGKHRETARYRQTVKEIRKAITTHLADRRALHVVKSIRFNDHGNKIVDGRVDASSLFGLLYFGVLAPDDVFTSACFESCEETLWWRQPIGGMARYDDDKYYRVDDRYPNPWIITTLWHAKFLIMTAQSDADMQPVRDLLQWAVDRALPSGILPEQVHPVTGAPLSATPLVWSHSTFVETVIDYLEKLEALGVAKARNPLPKD